MDPARKIFVSYVREDSATVMTVAARLEAAGFAVWLDRANLVGGQRWKTAIREAIREGAAMIACFSDSHLARDVSYITRTNLAAVAPMANMSAASANASISRPGLRYRSASTSGHRPPRGPRTQSRPSPSQRFDVRMVEALRRRLRRLGPDGPRRVATSDGIEIDSKRREWALEVFRR